MEELFRSRARDLLTGKRSMFDDAHSPSGKANFPNNNVKCPFSSLDMWRQHAAPISQPDSSYSKRNARYCAAVHMR